MTSALTGNCHWTAGTNGGTFTFGDVPFEA